MASGYHAMAQSRNGMEESLPNSSSPPLDEEQDMIADLEATLAQAEGLAKIGTNLLEEPNPCLPPSMGVRIVPLNDIEKTLLMDCKEFRVVSRICHYRMKRTIALRNIRSEVLATLEQCLKRTEKALLKRTLRSLSLMRVTDAYRRAITSICGEPLYNKVEAIKKSNRRRLLYRTFSRLYKKLVFARVDVSYKLHEKSQT